jgi:hypothetical protein
MLRRSLQGAIEPFADKWLEETVAQITADVTVSEQANGSAYKNFTFD